MNEITATLIILMLFTLRFAVPLLVILGFGRLMNRLTKRWQLQG